MKKLGIITVIETGDLEQKTKLLVDSIRTFGGEICNSKIWAIKPRKGKAITQETLSFLHNHDVEFIDIDLNKRWHLYGFANKIYAAAYIEEQFGNQYETLLFLDSDTIVTDAIDPEILEGKYKVAAKPIDSKHLAITPSNPISKFWERIYEACNFNDMRKLWTVRTTIENLEIYAYFNSGVVFVDPSSKIFSQWLENFHRVIKNKKFYHLAAKEYFFLEQALLAGTILKEVPKPQVKVLDHTYNYSLNFINELNEKVIDREIKILHYDKSFQNDHLDISFLSEKAQLWLQPHMPLKAYEDNFVQKYYKVFRYIAWRLKNKLLLTLKQT